MWAAAINKKHQPPLKRTQLGVQTAFTTGHTPEAPKAQPLPSPAMPATASHCTFAHGLRSLRRTFPAISPRIMVPINGTKFNVVKPLGGIYGFSRGNRFRNQKSKVAAGLLLICQWAAKPFSPCSASHSLETPTRA